MTKRRPQTKAGGGGSSSRRHITNREEAVMDPVLPPLPNELAEDILLRLPVKSLAASRCVSPPWNGLISSLAFARRHRDAAAARAGVAPRFVSVPVCRDEHIHLRVFLPRYKAPRPSPCAGCPRVFSGAVLVGRPCEGEFFVCNPSTGGALRLPPRRPACYFQGAGLGYNGGEGRLKAVLLERAGDPPRLQCGVVTVGAGEWHWREPRGQWTPAIICVDDALVAACTDPVFADGRLHWMLLDAARGNLDGVLAFELGSETFRRIPLPPPSADDENLPGLSSERETMAEADDRLCLVRNLSYPRRKVAVFEVWMLRDYNRLSWSLDRRIDLTPHVGKELTRLWEGEFFVVGYTGESRKILLATTGFVQRAYMYAPDTGELRTLACWNDYGVQPQLRLVLHQESLLQVDGMEYDNKDIKFTFADE